LAFCWTTICRNSSGVFKSVFATRFTDVIVPLVRPSADNALFCDSDAHTSDADSPCAAIWSGFNQMRIANVRPPSTSAFCTPDTAESRGCTTRTR